MPQWGNTDNQSNAVSWAAATIGAGAGHTAEAANNNALYANTTANAFINNMTVGLFGVDQNEIYFAPGASTGWVLKRERSDGRVSYETLVAMHGMTGDGDGNTFGQWTITITGNPVNVASHATNTVSFTVAYTVDPPFLPAEVSWQVNTGTSWTTLTNNTTVTGATTNTLSWANVAASMNNYTFRALVIDGDGLAVNATSNAATLTIS